MVTLVLKPEIVEKKSRLKELQAKEATRDGLTAGDRKERDSLLPLAQLRPQIEVNDYQVEAYIGDTGAYMLPERQAAIQHEDDVKAIAQEIVDARIAELGLVSAEAVKAMIAEALAAK